MQLPTPNAQACTTRIPTGSLQLFACDRVCIYWLLVELATSANASGVRQRLSCRSRAARSQSSGSTMSALHNAARDNPAKCAEILAQGNANVNARDRHSRTPLHLAAWAGHVRFFYYMQTPNAPPRMHMAPGTAVSCLECWRRMTEEAARVMQASAVEALLAAGADVHAAASDDTSSLHFAAMKGHTAAVKILLANGELLRRLGHVRLFADRHLMS